MKWAAIPKDLPPRSTVNDYFRRWDYDNTLGRIHHALYIQCRAVRFARSRQMGTNDNRGRYDRSKLRYPSDLTDAEWAVIAPPIPPAKRGANKTRSTSARSSMA